MQNHFPANLKFLRNKNNETQEDISNVVNKERSLIGHWEAGNREPTVEDIIKLSNHFHVAMHDLIEKDLRKKEDSSNTDGIYIQKADGTSVFLKNASGADKALVELPEEQKKAILAMIGKTMDEIDKELDGE